MTTFYRFRSVDRLLDGTTPELENQSIYFATPEQLNDPVEGFRDLFWLGDHVAWKNLFVHYLRCLEQMCSLLIVAGEEHHTISVSDIPVRLARDEFPTEAYRKLFWEIRDHFLSNPVIEKYIDAVSSTGRKIRRSELQFHLQMLHIPSLRSIAGAYQKNGLMQLNDAAWPSTEGTLSALSEKMFERAASDIPENDMDALFETYIIANKQLNLLKLHNQTFDPGKPNKTFVLVDFPEAYVQAIEHLVFPPWYTACFMSECDNSAVWGHYAQNHTGVCLMFEAEDKAGRTVLPLQGINGWSSSGPSYGVLPLEFLPISYSEGYGEIDFFRSLGRLPHSTLESTWHADADGSFSSCAADLLKDEASWRDRYWKFFLRDITRKTSDWAYEKEHRLILPEIAIDRSDPKVRVLKYDFRSLKGLIFGMKTPIGKKLEMMKIIERKCAERGRTDFQFHQAYYSAQDKCIKHTEMRLLQIRR